MSDIIIGALTLLLYGGILILMFTVSYKKFKKTKHKSKMKKRLKLIKGDNVDK